MLLKYLIQASRFARSAACLLPGAASLDASSAQFLKSGINSRFKPAAFVLIKLGGRRLISEPA